MPVAVQEPEELVVCTSARVMTATRAVQSVLYSAVPGDTPQVMSTGLPHRRRLAYALGSASLLRPTSTSSGHRAPEGSKLRRLGEGNRD